MGMSMSDAEAAEFYEDPAHLEPVGEGRRRHRPVLTEHVPIRFNPATISRVRLLAHRERKSVSAWIRAVVEREVERRLPEARTVPAATNTTVRWLTQSGAYDPRARTEGDPELELELA